MKRILTGIKDKMLTQVLRELEEDAVVRRKMDYVLLPKVEYMLT
jgi:DNA-binding HxlR family transcriptional regulator